MEKSFNNPALAETLSRDFPSVEVTFRQFIFGGNVSAFFLKFPDEQILEKDWRKLANAIAVFYQSRLSDEFEKWNIYLFYQCIQSISRDLKYKIENDTFSSRKIFIAGEYQEDEVVKEFIVNKDLTLSNKLKLEEEFIGDPIIWDAVIGKVIKAKKKRTYEAANVLEAIVKKIKQEAK